MYPYRNPPPTFPVNPNNPRRTTIASTSGPNTTGGSTFRNPSIALNNPNAFYGRPNPTGMIPNTMFTPTNNIPVSIPSNSYYVPMTNSYAMTNPYNTMPVMISPTSTNNNPWITPSLLPNNNLTTQPTLPLSNTNNNKSQRSTSISINPTKSETDQQKDLIVNIRGYDELLDLFYKQPVKIEDLVKLDLFCIKSAMPRTAFEEADLFSTYLLENTTSVGANLLLSETDSNNNNVSPLSNAIRKLYLEAFQEDDRFAATLLSYHLLLYKRLKILEKVQEFQQLKLTDCTALKNQFEQLGLNNSLSIIPPNYIFDVNDLEKGISDMITIFEHQFQPLKREDLDTFLKSLAKAMQKSDVKKGLFAKLRKSKSEAIHKLITKHAYPLAIPSGLDESTVLVKNYLIDYSKEKENGLKRRTKSIHSLLLLGLSEGSLLDLLYVLQCLLTLSDDPSDPLLVTETEEDGAFVFKPETLKPLQQFQFLIKTHVDQMLKDEKIKAEAQNNSNHPLNILNQYSLLSNANLNARKPFTAKRLFVFLLNQIDLLTNFYLMNETNLSKNLNTNNSSVTISLEGDNLSTRVKDFSTTPPSSNCLLVQREKYLKNRTSANVKFCIELSAHTFQILVDLIDRVLQIGSSSPSCDIRQYSLCAILRILHLNIKSLSLWKKNKENIDELISRLTSVHSHLHSYNVQTIGNRNGSNVIDELRTYFFDLLQQSGKTKTPIPENNNTSPTTEPIIEKKENNADMIETDTKQSQNTKTEEISEEKGVVKQIKQQQKIKQENKTNHFLFESISQEEEIDADDYVLVSSHQKSKDQRIAIAISRLGEKDLKHIGDCIIDVLVCGFTLFYPTIEDQRQFIEDAIASCTSDSLKRRLLRKILERMVHDFTLFDTFIGSGIGFSDTSIAIPFVTRIIDFLKRQYQITLSNFVQHLVDTKSSSSSVLNVASEDMIAIVFLTKRLLLMWQNTLVQNISSLFSKGNNSSSVLSNSTSKVLLEYTNILLTTCEQLLNETCTVAAEIKESSTQQNETKDFFVQLLKSLAREVQEGIIGWLVFPVLHSFSKLLWKGNNNSKVYIDQHFEKLTQFLYPHIVELLRSVDLLSQFVGIKEDYEVRSDTTEKTGPGLLFDWAIVESDHPYESGASESKEITFNSDSSQSEDTINNHSHEVISVGIKFDPRCITAGPEDNLRINTSQKITNVQALQFSGHGSTIPIIPLVTWGNSLTTTFRSGDKHSQWGMRCLVVPVFNYVGNENCVHFLYELEKLLGHLGGRCTTYVLSSYPYSSDEDKYVDWLDSKLFANGIRDDQIENESNVKSERSTELLLKPEDDFSNLVVDYNSKLTNEKPKYNTLPSSNISLEEELSTGSQSDQTKTKVMDINDKFLLDMIDGNNEAGQFCQYLYLRIFKNEAFTMMMQNVADVVTSERAVVAVTLKHTGLVALARKLSEIVADCNPFSTPVDEKSLMSLNSAMNGEGCDKLKSVWRKIGRPLRQWMVQTKQQKQLAYRDMRDFIVQKCKFLLQLESSYLSKIYDRDEGFKSPSLETLEKPWMFKKTQQSQQTNLVASKSYVLSQLSQIAANKIRLDRDQINLSLITDGFINDISTKVVQFVQSDIIPSRMLNLMRMRRERALNRATSFQMFNELIQSTQFNSVKAEIIHGIKSIRQTRSMKKCDSPNFHYFNNVEGCGSMYQEIMSHSFKAFLRGLFTPLDAWLIRTDDSIHEDNQKKLDNLVRSGLLREILDISLISFRPSDVEWILYNDFLTKLSHLMYNTVPVQTDLNNDNSKFKRKDGFIEEHKEMNKKAWKIFRLLSIRCVEMLEESENFEGDFTYTQHLNSLRDTVFNLLFNDLKRIIADMNTNSKSISVEVLEEMLSLMVSLCNTSYAQLCLSSERFQQLLLPLLKLSSRPNVQELALKLCSQLILSSGSSIHNNTVSPQSNNQGGLNDLIVILFEFFGSYEMRQVVGYSPDNTSVIGIRIAKEIFLLIRKLFSEDNVSIENGSYFVKLLVQLMNSALFDSTETILKNLNRHTDISKDLQCLFATLTIMGGFKYIPQIGEQVLVDMNGRQELAKVKEIEETYHLVKIELEDKSVVHREHFVASENIHVITQKPLLSFPLTEQHVHSICKFVVHLGRYLFNDEFKNDISSNLNDDQRLLYSSLWIKCLKWLMESISNSKGSESVVLKYLLDHTSTYRVDEDSAIRQDFIQQLVLLGEKATTFQLLTDSNNSDNIINVWLGQKTHNLSSLVNYGKELKLDSCSFTFTGKKFHRQYYYSCISCNMSTNQAVCAFCARTCHRGHRLGEPEFGDFYCDCGAGEGKNHSISNCKSLKHAPSDPILTSDRMESLILRLQKLMPVLARKNMHTPETNLATPTTSLLNFMVDSNSILSNPTLSNSFSQQKGPSRFVVPESLVTEGVPYSLTTNGKELPILTFNALRLYSPKYGTLGTDHPVPQAWPGFYFEIELIEKGDAIAIGFSEMPPTPSSSYQFSLLFAATFGIYTLHTDTGNVFRGNTLVKSGYTFCSNKDVIGCGWSKEQRSIFFTKNGVNLGNIIPVGSTSLYPIIAMKGKNVQVKFNLTNQVPFQFTLSRTIHRSLQAIYEMNASEPLEHNNSIVPTQQKESATTPFITNTNEHVSNLLIESQIKVLNTIVNGYYSENDVRDAIMKSLNVGSFTVDMNTALSYLHRNAAPNLQASSTPLTTQSVPTIRQQLVQQLKFMGFDNEQLILKALQMAQDDINIALNLLLEGNVSIEETVNSRSPHQSSSSSLSSRISESDVNDKNVNNILLNESNGINFLGSEFNNEDMKIRLKKAMLQNPDIKINENNFCDIPSMANVKEGDIVVVSPRIASPPTDNSDTINNSLHSKKMLTLTKMRGRLGVVVKKLLNGAYITVSEDQPTSIFGNTNSVVTDFVETKNIYTPPHELKGFSLNDLVTKSTQFYIGLGSNYIHQILLNIVSARETKQAPVLLNLENTFKSSSVLWKAMKQIMIDAYHHLDNDFNFSASQPTMLLETSTLGNGHYDYDNVYPFSNKTLPSIETFELLKDRNIIRKDGKLVNIYQMLEGEALQEIQAFTQTIPYFRKFEYRKEYNILFQPPQLKSHFIHFCGTTSVSFILDERFSLPSTNDILTFYYDREGKKIAHQIKGGSPVAPMDRCFVITTNNLPSQAQIYFDFIGPNLKENVGLTFYAAPFTWRLSQRDAYLNPNMLLSSLILKYAAITRREINSQMSKSGILLSLHENTDEDNSLYHKYLPTLFRYLLTPFAPFKGVISDALLQLDYSSPQVLSSNVSNSPYSHLKLLKRFRVELEDLYRKFLRYSEVNAYPLPNFHSMAELMTVIRRYLVSDLCQSVFPAASISITGANNTLLQRLDKHHLYLLTSNTSSPINACTCCTHTTARNQSLSHHKQYDSSFAKYFSNESFPCQSQVATEFQVRYDPESNCNVETTIVPVGSTDGVLRVNPSDWFEHVSWVDQLTIIREFLEVFSQSNGRNFPDWTLFESILERKKKVTYKESKHPYNLVNDSAKIRIPGAKTLYITFDKHSKTHKCDRLNFSTKQIGSDDLGSFGGEELKDKTIVVHGTDTIFFEFTCGGGDHEVKCSNCRSNIVGVRYHCVECEEYDLCEKCIQKQSKVHSEMHLFLKIRRPVDCTPALIPSLYSQRWKQGSQFKANIHTGVKCDNCGMNPIRGVRYWCENCENYNLCEKCAETEYKYHDRMHIFLRVVRPLPPKNQMPANHLPYGLVYEKEMDSHWGYLFSVSSSIDSCPKMSQLEGEMDEVRTLLKIRKIRGISNDECELEADDINPDEFDKQLIEYVETFSNCGWQSLEWNQLSPKSEELKHLGLLEKVPLNRLRYRFTLLKLFNRRISRIINLLDFSHPLATKTRAVFRITDILSKLMRHRIFHSVKLDAWQHSVTKSHITIEPIGLRLNRHLASDAHPTDRQRNAFNSLFIQAYNQVKAMHPRILSSKKASWKVTLIGEAADDYGGPFRESLTNMCQELLATDPTVLDLFIPTPNKIQQSGENLEKFIPNPQSTSDQHLKWYEFVGVIMGIGILTKNVLPFDFPSIVWKMIVSDLPLTWEDLRSFDEAMFTAMKALLEQDSLTLDPTFTDDTEELMKMIEENFNETYCDRTFTTIGSDGKEVELVPNGSNVKLTYGNRNQYVELIRDYRLNREFKVQLNALRKGLYSVITNRFFPLLTWQEFEKLVCGVPDLDVEKLKQHTIYEGYNAQSREVKLFWEILQSFTPEQRSLYLKFVWGRSRMPINESEAFTNPMKIQKLDRTNPDAFLPLSHTCFFSIELPSYSSKEIMKEKLLYAITNCKAIDIDFTTSALEAQNAIGSSAPTNPTIGISSPQRL
ncbi:hypothetical protein ABK040_015526 [Willaertia magna]